MLTLQECAMRYKTDKCKEFYHNYISSYEKIFGDPKNINNVLEIGLGFGDHEKHMLANVTQEYRGGNCLLMWRDYFPGANIFGVDIFAPGMMHGYDRIQTFVADQSSASDLNRVLEAIGGKLDIVIDDGSHLPEHQKLSFMYLERGLSEGGVYVIEDVSPAALEGFRDLSIFPTEFRAHVTRNYEMTIFDTRQEKGIFDDVLVVFKKKITNK